MNFRVAIVAVALLAIVVNGHVFAQPQPSQTTTSPESLEPKPTASGVPPPPVPTPAKAWIVMDYATKQVLAGENIHAQLAPASMTKVMTSYVIAAETASGRIHKSDLVMMTENAWRKGGAGTDGSYSGFPVNRTASLDEMEHGMIVQSGNDAAIALAEHVAGSEAAFAALMNQYAQRLGLRDTHFVDVTGLSVKGHYSSAYDIALMGRALIHDYPLTYAYNKIKALTVNGITQPNRNLLLWRDASLDGIKTGHTAEAGYCIVNSAQRGDQRLISVVMGGSSERQRAAASLALLNWGFRFYQTIRLYTPAQTVTTQHIWKGLRDQLSLGVAQPVFVSVPQGRQDDLKVNMNIPRVLTAPITKGQTIGTLNVMFEGRRVAQAPLVAQQDVPEGGFFKQLWDNALLWWETKS